jgi:G:T-mismatch repair DNA endonuclease (very short patch repair protein)
LKSNDKALIGKELDIVIPEIKLAIEYNGLYWHSINGSKYKFGQHLSKTQSCEKLGYRLLYVWEDEWADNPE